MLELPVQARMPSGRVITDNGARVASPGDVRIACIVDDRTAAIAWVEDH